MRAQHVEPENLEESHGLTAGRREKSAHAGEVTGGIAVRNGAKNKLHWVRVT